jgi:hypothetical protein
VSEIKPMTSLNGLPYDGTDNHPLAITSRVTRLAERDAVIDKRKAKCERIISFDGSPVGISGDFLEPLNITQFTNFSDGTEISMSSDFTLVRHSF